MALKIKICGVADAGSVEAAVFAGCDALGFNFYSGSPRCVSAGAAAELAARVPEGIWKVGVFVNHSRESVAELIRLVGLDTVQFSGDEDAAFCRGWGSTRVIKAVRLGGGSGEAAELQGLAAAADILLFDRFSKEAFGGTGEEIPEALLAGPDLRDLLRRSFLSGGLTPETVRRKIELLQPAGVDAASGVERAPGVKDAAKIQKFISEARAAARCT